MDKNKIVGVVGNQLDQAFLTMFLTEIENYQSNHHGSYDRNRLVIAHRNLPQNLKDEFEPDNTNYLFRGADGTSYRSAISFSDKNTATVFGTYAIPFKELKSYKGIFDTHKVVAYIEAHGINADVGDDEGEVVVVAPVWRSGITHRLERYRV